MRTHNTLKCVLPMQINSSLLLSIPGLTGWILDILGYVYTSKKVTVRTSVWTISQDHLLNIIVRIYPSFDMTQLTLSQIMLRYDTGVSTGWRLFPGGAWIRLSCSEEETRLAITRSAMALAPESEICPIFSTVGISCPYAGQGVRCACWGCSGQCSRRQNLSEFREESQILNNCILHQKEQNIYLNWMCLEEQWQVLYMSFVWQMSYISFLMHKKTNSVIADESWTDGNRISCIWKINLIVVLYLELKGICTDENAITWDSK